MTFCYENLCLLRFLLNCSKEENSPCAMFDESSDKNIINAKGQFRVLINPHFCIISVFIQPLHQWQVKPCPQIERLRCVQMQVAEGR